MLDETAPGINRQPPRSSEPAAPTPSDHTPAISIEDQLDRLEGHMASLQVQVQRLQRMASLGTVAATLAHEFNNLLTPIISYSQYALSREDPTLLRTAVEKTHSNAERLSTLCGHILGLATDDQMGPTIAEIKPLLFEAVSCLGRDLEKDNIAFSVDAPDDLTARVRRGSLRQILFNLVLNARQALFDRAGKLTLAARSTEEGHVEIAVSDTGLGIRPEHMDRIFEPFFTTKQHGSQPERGGVGLGLHVCRQLVEEQNGTITVESKPGQGAKFTLRFPAE